MAPLINDTKVVLPEPADDKILELVHTRDYIQTIRSASEGIILKDILQYISTDNLNPLTRYVPKGIEEASRIIVGSSILTGKLIAEKS